MALIKHDGKYYMVTESFRQRQILFYEAERFPYEWRLVFNIAECGFAPAIHPRQCFNSVMGYLDPSIFRYGGKWWIYASVGFLEAK